MIGVLGTLLFLKFVFRIDPVQEAEAYAVEGARMSSRWFAGHWSLRT